MQNMTTLLMKPLSIFSREKWHEELTIESDYFRI